jgi:hypothetical protein
MRNFTCAQLFLSVFVAATSAAAKDLSNAQIFICAPTIAHQCSAQEKCSSGPPDSVNIPQFFRVDLKKQIVIGEGANIEKRTSKISNVENGKRVVILQGTQLERGWSAIINKSTGHLVVTASADNTAITLFGACTSN